MSDEMRLRAQTLRATVHTIDDTGSDQVAVVETHAGVKRSVAVHQPFGIASHAPADGAVSVVLAIGGDEADTVALPPANPQAARMGNLPEGDTVLYDAAGQRVHLSGGVIVRIEAVQSATISIGGAVVLSVTAQGVQIQGDLQVSGKITATGDVVGNGISLGQHRHNGVQSGGSLTGLPVGS